MKNTDLRVGNLVSLSGSLALTVYEIHEDCFYAKDAKGSSFKNTWADLKPIPLTEEILLKSGFTVYDIKYGYFSHKDLPGILQLFDGVAEYSIDSNEVCWVNGLHQLQNLFHSIIGKEMVVNI